MDLNEFSKANLARCEASNGFNHHINSWNTAEWTNALAGEAGEGCNFAKKLLRVQQGIPGNDITETPYDLRIAIGKEMADVICYADLICQSLGLNTEGCLVSKWNEKSEKIGYPVRLP